MLSDEERKTIENLKIEYEKLMKEDNILFPLYKSDAKRLIDIIEKQSKEIEEYKKQLDLDYVDNHFVPIERYNQLKKEIEELKKENKEIREWKYVIDNPIDLEKLKELDLIKIKGKEYISKDKIKAKIEEIDKAYEDSKNEDGESEYYYPNYTVEVLQSLLEKE